MRLGVSISLLVLLLNHGSSSILRNNRASGDSDQPANIAISPNAISKRAESAIKAATDSSVDDATDESAVDSGKDDGAGQEVFVVCLKKASVDGGIPISDVATVAACEAACRAPRVAGFPNGCFGFEFTVFQQCYLFDACKGPLRENTITDHYELLSKGCASECKADTVNTQVKTDNELKESTETVKRFATEDDYVPIDFREDIRNRSPVLPENNWLSTEASKMPNDIVEQRLDSPQTEQFSESRNMGGTGNDQANIATTPLYKNIRRTTETGQDIVEGTGARIGTQTTKSRFTFSSGLKMTTNKSKGGRGNGFRFTTASINMSKGGRGRGFRITTASTNKAKGGRGRGFRFTTASTPIAPIFPQRTTYSHDFIS